MKTMTKARASFSPRREGTHRHELERAERLNASIKSGQTLNLLNRLLFGAKVREN